MTSKETIQSSRFPTFYGGRRGVLRKLPGRSRARKGVHLRKEGGDENSTKVDKGKPVEMHTLSVFDNEERPPIT